MSGTKHVYWRRLDNAAKIFPATSSRKDPRVFRFYCMLKEEVDGQALQTALERTVERYPLYLSVMRRGLFWYYLEKSALRPAVTPEVKQPCTELYLEDRKSLLFEVTYYKRRINLEIFHALTDGTGALRFLKELTGEYLRLRHPKDQRLAVDSADGMHTLEDLESDGFRKYYGGGTPEKIKKVKSHQLSGSKMGYGELQITEAVVSTDALLAKAREYGVSATVLVTAVLLCAIEQEMTQRQKARPVALMVPVNLRKYFPSPSMLNFFGWIEPGYRFDREETSLDDVVRSVAAYFKEELTKERLAGRMSSLVGLEYNPLLRAAPLGIKNLGMLIGARLSKGNITAIFSNVGKVDMPKGYEAYIDRFGVFISTPKIELCMCSFEDQVTLSFTSCFRSPNIQRNFFCKLRELGIEVRLEEADFPGTQEGRRQSQRFFQWVTFICITAAVAGIMANVMFFPGVYWSLFVLAGAGSMWSALAVGYYKRHNLLKDAVWQLFLITGVCVLWDHFTGWRGWSVDYVLPGVSLFVSASMAAVSRLRRLQPQEYMTYFVIAGLFGMIPGLLLFCGAVGNIYLSVVCAGLSFLFLMVLAIFRGRELFQELHKKLHL